MPKRPLFETQTRHAELCPKCGAELHLRKGKKGLFLGCSTYPACDYLKPLQQTEGRVLKFLQQDCPECSHQLVLRQGHYGMFIGCSHYPECRYVVHEAVDEAESEEAEASLQAEVSTCPSCKVGHLVARRGKQGKVFYGCDRFPQCRFNLAHKPHRQPCPKCGYPLAFHKTDLSYQCCNRACRHQFQVE